MEMVSIKVTLDSDLLAKVDAARGTIPRATFIRDLLDRGLKRKEDEARTMSVVQPMVTVVRDAP